MPIYVYETIPAAPDEPVERFELRQSMADAPLTQHPERPVPVRRVLSGGLVTFMPNSADACAAPGAARGAAPMGGCGAGNCCMH
ncbi:MAG: hypothetical protein K2Y26_00825 [Gemmatimonadaceae bacterium]|jgi:hypothetical protein|nr:zinc ribbon domain-containing protein [Gemmatimonadaceae bacterium]MBX9854038.1 hypothetical protein [Gemmatimonadaceae bacterium]